MNIMNSPNHSLSGYIGYLVAMFCTFLLAACGGGGGSAGNIPNQPSGTPTPASLVRSLVITTSSDILPASGVAGTEVTVTVLARDAGNNAVPGAQISLSASSGVLTFILPSSNGGATPTPGVTDANGMVMAKLSTGGDRSMRPITINAVSGSVAAATPRTVTVSDVTSSISLVASSSTLQSSGSIKVTALVVDNNRNAVQNAVVNFNGGTGVIVLDNGNKTDVNGMVTATLTAGNNAALRDITVTVALDPTSGVATPATLIVPVVVARPTLILTSSSGILASSGTPGSEVVLTVLALDANKNVIPNLKITLSSTSGALSVTGDQRTNGQGIITERLGTAGNPDERDIQVTASATGAEPVNAVIRVQGTKIVINSSPTVNATVTTLLNVTVTDSSDTPLANRTLTFSTRDGGQLRVKDGAAAITNRSGQLEFEYTAGANQTTERITISGLGTRAILDLTVNNNVFSVGAVTAQGANLSQGDINVCYPISVSSATAGVPSVGQVALSASRGGVFSDAACSRAQNASIPLNARGMAGAFIRGTSPGVATLVATLTPTTGTPSSTRGTFEFVAPLGTAPRITLQSDPSVVTANTQIDATQRATLRAVVRDQNNNVVKGATVNFSIVSDSSGGSIAQPSVVVTGSDGIATTSYIAGTNPTATDGVQIRAQIQGTTTAATTGLTVGRRALFITAGTGNFLDTSAGSEVYLQRFQVLVSDAAGQAVPDVTVTASAIPSGYGKGELTFNNATNTWVVDRDLYHGCNNEDTDRNGILDIGEDFNNNGRLEPGIPVAVTISGKTDPNGAATITMRYARNLANWLTVDLTISAIVAGSEARYTAHETLFGVAEDFNRASVSPPGRISPFGVNPCNTPL